MGNTKIDANDIYDRLNTLYPDARCELNYNTHFELLCAVMLSAQTTDVSVNKVTPQLFKMYPDAFAMAKADVHDVMNLIHSIGLYKNKAINLIKMSNKLVLDHQGIVPNTMEALIKLDGVGRKTANVVLSELFQKDAIAVDTHVSRIAQRLKIAKVGDDVTTIEEKMKKYFPIEQWRKIHHLFIFFGRYRCHAKNPQCNECPFEGKCRKDYM